MDPKKGFHQDVSYAFTWDSIPSRLWTEYRGAGGPIVHCASFFLQVSSFGSRKSRVFQKFLFAISAKNVWP